MHQNQHHFLPATLIFTCCSEFCCTCEAEGIFQGKLLSHCKSFEASVNHIFTADTENAPGSDGSVTVYSNTLRNLQYTVQNTTESFYYSKLHRSAVGFKHKRFIKLKCLIIRRLWEENTFLWFIWKKQLKMKLQTELRFLKSFSENRNQTDVWEMKTVRWWIW